MYEYEHSWKGILKYIDDNIEDEEQKKLAKQRVLTAKKTRDNKLMNGLNKETLGGYPINYVFKQVINGNYKRHITPQCKPTKQDFIYEGINVE